MKKTRPISESDKIEQQYRKSLMVRVNWLRDHQDTIINLLKGNEDRYQADAPSDELRAKINKLRSMFATRFTAAMTSRLAKRFFTRLDQYNQTKMKTAFNPLGINLKDTLKRENLQDYQGVAIQNQVDLIKSIDGEYFDKIEKIVFNGMQSGTNWETMGKQIREATGATAKRSRFIARDQTSTINAQLSKKRAANAGITKAEWLKTRKIKTKNYTPRQSHLKADGKTFDINKGLLVDGEYIFPAEKIGCTCQFRFILPD